MCSIVPQSEYLQTKACHVMLTICFVVRYLQGVTECLRQGKLIDEDDYLVEGDCSAHQCIGGTQTRFREMNTVYLQKFG